MGKVEAIKALISFGRVQDVLAFVEGDSIYISAASEGAPQSPELRRIWIMVVHHLRFISEFGNTPDKKFKDGKYLSPYPEEFEQWLDEGVPGIAEEDIQRYLEQNPL
ncbi:hypothetical protein [Pseudomonas panipatensis]|uniref:hypothetical protein n=1 Tax=Pseudomonas panipatensis TaxID=428992 RepID=UPI0011137621|nr:hypothetical protein [Pseudomonas panipatensis]